MKKKIAVLTLMLMLVVSTVSFAAISSSGSKSSSSGMSKSSTSSSPSSRSSSSPSSSSQMAPSGSYKPSAPASSYSDTAPAKQQTPNVQSQQNSSGGFWRNASMFGGGMLAGSLFSHMFGGYGMGGGGSSLFGMLFNLLILGGVVMGIRYVWDKYKNNNRNR